MNDEQIMHKGGDEGDIEVYANQHGANLTKLDVEIEEKIQEQQFMTRRNSELIVVNDEPMLAYDGLKLDEQVAANMLVAYNHALKTHHQELQKALKCSKDMGDGSICGCKLDCHLHDWRQRDELQKARKSERERIEAVFKEHVPPHTMDLEDSVWLKRLLNKAFNHDKNVW